MTAVIIVVGITATLFFVLGFAAKIALFAGSMSKLEDREKWKNNLI